MGKIRCAHPLGRKYTVLSTDCVPGTFLDVSKVLSETRLLSHRACMPRIIQVLHMQELRTEVGKQNARGPVASQRLVWGLTLRLQGTKPYFSFHESPHENTLSGTRTQKVVEWPKVAHCCSCLALPHTREGPAIERTDSSVGVWRP